MQILTRLFVALMFAGLLAACETTAVGTGSATVFSPNGQPVQTQQSIDVKVKGGPFSPNANAVMGNMLGGNATGGYGYPYYYGPQVIAGYPGFMGYQPGSYRRADGSVGCGRTRPSSGADDCEIWAVPAPQSYGRPYNLAPRSGGGGNYGTGQYYYDPRTGTQQQDIRPGFKVN
jgi:hypothetical protein